MMEISPNYSVHPHVAVAGILLGILAASSSTSAQEVHYAGSFQFATGDYIFMDRTNSFYFLNGFDLLAGPVRIFANVPIISQSTPWVSYGTVVVPTGGSNNSQVHAQVMGRGKKGHGQTPVVLPTEGVSRDTAIGDPMVRADIEVAEENETTPSVRLGASVKVPFADVDQGFGTGKWDYGGGVSLGKGFGRNSVFADVFYWVLGDLPDLELRDTLAFSLAYGRVIGDGTWSILASFSSLTPIIEDTEPPAQIGVGLTYLLDTGRSLMLSAAFGLTESSPDFSMWVGWRIAL